jgi:signal transduction histidine kinase/ActR/RegA family two-component response regulator
LHAVGVQSSCLPGPDCLPFGVVPLAEFLARLASAVLGLSALAVATLVAVEIGRRPRRRREPLALGFALVFVAVGLRGMVEAVVGRAPALAGPPAVLLTADLLAAAATAAFLAFHRRYGLFVENADIVHEYETGYAAKEREARALAQVNEELRRLDELKSEFLAMVSHELRTPLTAIVGYSRLLMRQVHGPLTPKQLEHQEAIFRSAQRLTELINDLLDVARLEAARVQLETRPTDVHQALENVLATVRVAAQAKQITIADEIPADLPLVQADSSRLHQILANLIGNAIKFTPAGGHVRVRAGRQKDQVWVAVEDTGVGIPSEELARIWDPFYQVESPLRRRHAGSGLGLAIVRRLVELHGGAVRAESAGENRGSRFTFTLPVAGAAPRPAGPAGEPDRGIEPVLAGRDVLIVEDDPRNQDLMRAVVEDLLGGVARVCPDGGTALEAAMKYGPVVVLLDLMLPGVSGWEVARRLRQHPETRGVPIIAVSALARPQERESALHAGCDAYLAKPFTPDDLARVIAGTLATGATAR